MSVETRAPAPAPTRGDHGGPASLSKRRCLLPLVLLLLSVGCQAAPSTATPTAVRGAVASPAATRELSGAPQPAVALAAASPAPLTAVRVGTLGVTTDAHYY